MRFEGVGEAMTRGVKRKEIFSDLIELRLKMSEQIHSVASAKMFSLSEAGSHNLGWRFFYLIFGLNVQMDEIQPLNYQTEGPLDRCHTISLRRSLGFCTQRIKGRGGFRRRRRRWWGGEFAMRKWATFLIASHDSKRNHAALATCYRIFFRT